MPQVAARLLFEKPWGDFCSKTLETFTTPIWHNSISTVFHNLVQPDIKLKIGAFKRKSPLGFASDCTASV